MAVYQGRCKNCDKPLEPGWKYCPACGQTSNPHRLSLHEIGHDLLHALMHVDRSALSLLRLLVVQPGVVARDYVAGKRKRYFGPFAFLVVAVAVGAAAIQLSGMQMVLSDTPNAAADFLEKFLGRHVNLLFFLQVPLLAAMCRLIGFWDRFNYAEYLVLAAYTSAIHILYALLLIIPVSYVFSSNPAAIKHVYFASLPLWPLYFGFAMSQFLERRRWVSAIKGAAAAVLTQAAAVLLTSSITNLVIAFRTPHG